MLELIDGSATCRGSSTHPGSVEFEVGKALYGLLNAGFIHRIGQDGRAGFEPPRAKPGRRASQPRHRVLQDGDARRGDARVPSRARAAERRPVGALLHRARARAPAEMGRRRSPRSRTSRARAERERRRCFTISRTRSSSMQRYDEARAALDEAVRRGGGDGPARAYVARRRLVCSAAISPRADDVAHRGAAVVRRSGRRRRPGFTTPRSPRRCAATRGARRPRS